MKGRIRKKRKKQAYIEALERGNEYLKGALVRQEEHYCGMLKAAAVENDLTEMLLYAAVIQAGGSVEIKTEGLADMLANKVIEPRADLENHTVHITVMDKVKAKAVLDDGKTS
ncbi:hypothetical protein [Anaerotignum sp.]